MGIEADENGSYESWADQKQMMDACRLVAAWKLAGNGSNISRFASRGGPAGAKNSRKSFGAELADPYAQADETILSSTDKALRVVCLALAAIDEEGIDKDYFEKMLKDVVPKTDVKGVASSMEYLRDRVGVPRDLPLAAGRYLRAYLNWGIDTLLTK